jgi:integrase/recombinase XerD
MLENHVHAAITRRRLRSGPAANHVDDFADWLYSRDYRVGTVFRLLQSLASWTDWLTATGRSDKDFASGYRDCSRYIQSTPHVPYGRSPNQDALRAARLFLRFLVDRGELPEHELAAKGDRFTILRDFRAWMLEHRGVTTTTIEMYKPVLEELLDSLGEAPSEYNARALRNFVSRRGARHGSSYAQLTGTAVRSFMRFLGATGQSPSGLEHAIPPYVRSQQSSIPKYLADDDIRKVIAVVRAPALGSETSRSSCS